MGIRFRKSIKVGGARLNIGLQGISTTFGPRGTSINIGSRGVYANTGVPGTGITYRSKLGNVISQERVNRIVVQTPESTRQTQTLSVKFMLDEETGKTWYEGQNGEPLSEEIIAITKKQNKETIVKILDSESNKFNHKLDFLLQLHLETPPPDTTISYTPVLFLKSMPVPPHESNYIVDKPAQPDQKGHTFLTKRISILGNRVEEANKKIMDEYRQLVENAEQSQQQLDKKLIQDRQRYEEDNFQWKKEKEKFEQHQIRLKEYVEIERLTNIEAMQGFLEEHLDAIEWPLETNVSFEVHNGGTQVWIDVDLPEIEMMPINVAKVNHNKLNLTINELSKKQQKQNYLTHIHSLGFRLIGETFVALPSVQEIIMSGYSQRSDRRTGHIEDEYLFSVKVQRNVWEKINFSRLNFLNVVDCFETFELLRKTSKLGDIIPIEPFKP